jgi:hypothetical protein
MESKTDPTIEQVEQNLLVWEKWLYACFGAAIMMLIYAFIKAHENQLAINEFFALQKDDGSGLFFSSKLYAPFSLWRLGLWLFVQFATLAAAAILAFHSTWRKIPLSKRLNLIFGYLLAGGITLLSLGAQSPLDVSNGYNFAVFGYILALGLSYGWLRRKRDRAEELFP